MLKKIVLLLIPSITYIIHGIIIKCNKLLDEYMGKITELQFFKCYNQIFTIERYIVSD